MKSKTSALVISGNRSFISEYSGMLKNNNFYVDGVSNISKWKRENGRKLNICFVDNLKGDFDYKSFFKTISELGLQPIVINVGDNHRHISNGHHLLFSLNPRRKSVDLDIFIANIQQLVKREKARSELTATLLHDIRSPMNSLFTYIELLLNENFGKLTGGQINILEKAMGIGDQILDMLEEINDVYQNEQYAFQFEKEYFSIPQLIAEIIQNIRVQAEAKNIQINKEITKNIPDIFGDSFQISRVLTNVLDNAIKYSPPGSVIYIKAYCPKESSVEIEVSDNGGGISSSQLKKIFHKSFRAREIKKPQQGRGLGLYISRLIILAHRGKIYAENNNRGGLSVIFSLPVKE